MSHGGSALTTGRAFSNGAAVSISGKTGTAESCVAGGQKLTILMLCYAPSDNPQIAVAVVFPHNTNLTNGVGHCAILSTSITSSNELKGTMLYPTPNLLS